MNARAPYISLSMLILSSYAILYKFRALDENTLFFSWTKIFKTGMAEIFLLFVLCLLLSCVISRTKFESDEKWDGPVLFLGAFLLGAVFWSVPEIHADAGRYFAEAKYLEEYGASSFIHNWGVELNALTDFPVVPFMYGLILRFVGESKTYLQIFVTSLFAATSVLTYLIGKRLWNRNTGIYAALFLLSSPYLLSYNFTLVTIPLMFLLTAAVYATLNALDARRGKIWIVISVVFILLTILSKASGILLLSVIPAISLASYLKTRDRMVLYKSAAITLLSSAVVLTFVFYRFDVLVDITAHNLAFWMLKAVKLKTLNYPESSLSLLFFQISPMVTLLALCSSYFAFKKRDINYLLLLVWFLVPFIVMYNTRIRYTVPVLPAIAIMASLALGGIQSEKSRKFLASGIILCSIVVAVFGYLPFMHTYSEMNIKYAAEYTNTLESETIEVYATLSENDQQHYQNNYSRMEYLHYHTLHILIPIFDMYSSKKIATPEYGQRREPPRTDWTWQYNYPPPYYSRQSSDENAIVIISGTGQKIPENLEKRLKDKYRLAKVYSEREFSKRGSYVVKVYVPVIFI